MGVLRMKQVNRILSTYTADVSGVCSALYELGGMTVMHDASGCNSTYNTHDEPRWYQIPSMVYISALTEMEAMMGDDSKLVNDVCRAASELHPRFIALCGTPIPMMMGTDFPGLARLIEKKTGIPSFGFATNGTHSYLLGAGPARAGIARRFCPDGLKPEPAGTRISVNMLGVTPLDFSVTGNVTALRALLLENDFAVRSCWAMGSSMEELLEAGKAQVNLVLSAAGLPLAEFLREKYGAPYVVGLPIGKPCTAQYLNAIREAARTGENQSPFRQEAPSGKAGLIIGEAVWGASMRAALAADGNPARVLCPLEWDAGTLSGGDLRTDDEAEIAAAAREADFVLADPMYQPVVPAGTPFIRFPHEGYSGRIWRSEIPVFIGGGVPPLEIRRG